MFSPAERQTYPAALIRPAKFVPWVNWSLETIAFVHPWAERLSIGEAESGGRWWSERSWLIRQTTAERRRRGEACPTRALAPAQARSTPAWRCRRWCLWLA